MRVLFEPHLSKLIFPDGTTARVPWEITAQAEPGEETDTVAQWARKTGLVRRGDEVSPTLPMSKAA